MSNLYSVFKKLIPQEVLVIAEVVESGDGVCKVQLPGGQLMSAKGVANVGDKVFIQGTTIQSVAPNLPLIEVDI